MICGEKRYLPVPQYIMMTWFILTNFIQIYHGTSREIRLLTISISIILAIQFFPVLPSFRRVLSALLKSEENNTLDSAGLSW